MSKLGARRARLERDLEAVAEELRPLIIEAMRKDVPLREVANRSSYSTDRIRKIAREAGVEPRSKGRPKRARA